MAGERKGEAFEALTYLALTELGYELDKSLFWGKKPPGFSIDPDFVLGSLTEPTHWIMATSTGSAKEYIRKIWRNAGELFEVKRNFYPSPKVLDLVLEVNQSDGHIALMSVITDADIRLEHTSYGAPLLSLIDDLIDELPQNRDAKVIKLEQALNAQPLAHKAFSEYVQALKKALEQHKPQLNGLWNLLRQERKPKTQIARTTYIRRGIAKLMVFTPDVRNQIYESVDANSRIRKLPEYAFTLGFATKTVAGATISDGEIRSAVETLGKDVLEFVIAKSPQAEMQRWIEPLRSLEDTEIFLEYVRKHYKELTTPEGMLQHLQAQHKNPYYLLDRTSITGEILTVWLFYFVFNLAKASLGKGQGFGLAELGKRAQKYLNKATKFTADHTIWRLEIPHFINRTDGRNSPKEVLVACASVLAEAMRQIDLEHAAKNIRNATVKANLEDKLIPYRMFEPLPLLLEAALLRAKIRFTRVKAHPSFMGEYLDQPNKVATTPVYKVGSTLIHWKSAHGSHCNDKTKELAGRAQALRFQYKDKKFSKRVGVEKLILIVDGDFKEKHFASLLEAGWDEIYYPDELDKLAESLKGSL